MPLFRKKEPVPEPKPKAEYELTGWRKALFYFVLVIVAVIFINFIFFGFGRAGGLSYLWLKFMEAMIANIAWLIPFLLGYLLALGIPTPVRAGSIKKMWRWYIVPIGLACGLLFLASLLCPGIFQGAGRFLSLIWLCVGFCCGLLGPKPFLDIQFKKGRCRRMLVLRTSKNKEIYTFQSWLEKPIRIHENFLTVRSVWFYVAHYCTKIPMVRVDKGDYIMLAPATAAEVRRVKEVS